MNFAIIGMGHIGKEIARRAELLGWNLQYTARSDGIYKQGELFGNLEDYADQSENLDLAMLAIPTHDDGKIALNYIDSYINLGVKVVTCEKGALSNYFSQLTPFLNEVGYSATVGGGTRLLSYLNEHTNSNVEEIHAVLNGTLNYIFNGVAAGRSLGEVVKETKKLGYAEPGAEDILQVINGEALSDVPMKTAIVFNVGNLTTEKMQARDVRTIPIDQNSLDKVVRESSNWRYIVSIRKRDVDEQVIGGFTHQIEDWHISAGFKNINKNSTYKRLVPSGVNNALLISEGKDGEDGTYYVSGQGAGAEPTVSSMIKDAIQLAPPSSHMPRG